MEKMITKELVETTYLWCAGRLDNSHDAADLAQEILCTALQEIRRGRKIDHFHGWYWGMAQNRLRMYFRMKRNGAVSLDATEQLFIPDDTADALLTAEEIGELNHAISRLSAMHREMIILYYLRGMKISDIARTLDVPEGTVKRRLFDAKNDIRKGVTEMTNTGKSAYAPAEVKLSGGYSIPDYWNMINDLMTKQIFAVCACDPHTIREIADEIGVAPVYFEKKLQWLVDNGFLKEHAAGRYLTDFILYPAGKKTEFQAALSEIYETVGEEVIRAIRSVEDKIRALDFYGSDMPAGKLLWVWCVWAGNMLMEEMNALYRGKWASKVPENNGKTWRLTGTVQYPEEEMPAASLKIVPAPWSNLHRPFRTSGYRWVESANLFEAEPFDNRDSIFDEGNIDLFMRIYDNPRLALTPNEEENAAGLIRVGFLARREDGLYPAMPVMSAKVRQEIHEILRTAMSPIAMKYASAVGECAERMLLPVTRADLLEEFVHWTVSSAFFPIGYIFRYAMDTPGVLEIPADYSTSAAGFAVCWRK